MPHCANVLSISFASSLQPAQQSSGVLKRRDARLPSGLPRRVGTSTSRAYHASNSAPFGALQSAFNSHGHRGSGGFRKEWRETGADQGCLIDETATGLVLQSGACTSVQQPSTACPAGMRCCLSRQSSQRQSLLKPHFYAVLHWQWTSMPR
jgi:hypothetical protein